jgi:monothiol glutaredoxin
MDDATRQRLQTLVESHRIVLFMKGTKNFPQCGFSAQVVGILKQSGAEFQDVNVLADPEVREGMKQFSNWPTFPQLYVGGKLVGGCDIVTELHANGELAGIVASA